MGAETQGKMRSGQEEEFVSLWLEQHGAGWEEDNSILNSYTGPGFFALTLGESCFGPR